MLHPIFRRHAVVKSRFILAVLAGLILSPSGQGQTLSGTNPLTEQGDLAASMVRGIGNWLDLKIQTQQGIRRKDFEQQLVGENRESFLQNKIQTLKDCLGIPKHPWIANEFQVVSEFGKGQTIFENDLYSVYQVRWKVIENLEAEGLLVEPKRKATMNFLVIPSPDQSPEEMLGLNKSAHYPVAHHLASMGCRVIIPETIDRKQGFSNNVALSRATNIPRREFVYRMAYEMGYQINGLEVLKHLLAVSLFQKQWKDLGLGVYGSGDGGFQAMILGSISPEVKVIVADGCFYNKSEFASEPIDRNTWRLWNHFGDSELLFLSRGTSLVHLGGYPVYDGPKPLGNLNQAAPGKLLIPSAQAIKNELEQAKKYKSVIKTKDLEFFEPSDLQSKDQYPILLQTAVQKATGVQPISAIKTQDKSISSQYHEMRQQRQFQNMVEFIQRSWRNSETIRNQLIKAPANPTIAGWNKQADGLRKTFWEDFMGKAPEPIKSANPKSRLVYDTPEFKGYEITLELYDQVFAQGILLLPNDLQKGEKRPVVVCQHGLEGRPTDVCDPTKKTAYYNSFGADLARRGFIVFAPQNPYIGKHEFRQLQRKANPIGLTLFSFIIRQHEIILKWLKTLPMVEGDKIAFYGLSYGGKTAMRVPSILPDYCLSICSGDFNEWIGKNVSVDFPGSYMWTFEYEMYEFNLGMGFNYAEMAYLIAPRPFMVERGHSDGVGIDEMVSWEFSKVRRFYTNLGLPGAAEIEYFKGGHEINAKGTYAFLTKHLGWPRK